MICYKLFPDFAGGFQICAGLEPRRGVGVGAQVFALSVVSWVVCTCCGGCYEGCWIMVPGVCVGCRLSGSLRVFGGDLREGVFCYFQVS